MTYGECCEPFHRGAASPPTAEALMRSRFTAFALKDEGYLLRSWHSRSRPKQIDFSDGLRWLRLEVLSGTKGGLFDDHGTVMFEAHYTEAGERATMRENSHFTREDGQWRYTGPV
ncbi:YchJ family protein [Catelliglobosispora koreensis]|uniref:YchJ family protein n=1 Tax=Catelliglobosispora koreensis TaxID=129052 RepID=UPI003899345B